MKKAIYSLLFLSTSILSVRSIQCMENNNTSLGYIDKLMIKRILTEKGRTALEDEINNQPVPFSVKRYIKKDTSELSNAIFHIVDEHEITFKSNNPSNNERDMIDHCTKWQQNDEDIIATAKFYNKVVLITALNELEQCKK